MKNLLRLKELSKEDIFQIFKLADEIALGEYSNFLKGRTFVLFFPYSSIRTRMTFEMGIQALGGQSILFPSDTLDKKEALRDVSAYLSNWADCVIVRHSNIDILDNLASQSKIPIINAMTRCNYPCEILSDLYSLSNLRKNYLDLNYLYMGSKSNIGITWKEASEILNFPFSQSCPKGYEMDGILAEYNIVQGIKGKDIILTDSIREEQLDDFADYQITKELLDRANENALLNPCPPFYRGEEVSADAIDSKYFVGYEFKKSLLEVQQAVMIYCMRES